MEEQYVKDTYNKIAEHFNHTRYVVWNEIKNFLDPLPTNSIVLEIGCGNGKNMLYRSDLNCIGIDNSEKMVEICQKKNLSVTKNCMTDLPINDKSIDYTMSIASLHHLETPERRRKAINEMIRVTKKKIFLTVWNSVNKSVNSTKNKVINLGNSNYLIPWRCKTGILYRFYHLTTLPELKELLTGLNYTYFENYGNFVIEIKCD